MPSPQTIIPKHCEARESVIYLPIGDQQQNFSAFKSQAIFILILNS